MSVDSESSLAKARNAKTFEGEMAPEQQIFIAAANSLVVCSKKFGFWRARTHVGRMSMT
jgi:hypothetical protein